MAWLLVPGYFISQTAGISLILYTMLLIVDSDRTKFVAIFNRETLFLNRQIILSESSAQSDEPRPSFAYKD